MVAAGFPLGPVWARVVRSTFTVASRGVPALVMLSTAGPAVLRPRPASRVTTATRPGGRRTDCPCGAGLCRAPAGLPGDAITAMPPPRLNWAPGAGQTRVTEVTGTERGAVGADPALSEMGCRRPASA